MTPHALADTPICHATGLTGDSAAAVSRAQKGQFGACMPAEEILAMRRRIDGAA